MSEIDPIEFGKLVQSVETLTNQVSTLTVQVSTLQSTLSGGKGIVTGLMIAAGGLGAGTAKLLDHVFK